MPKRKRFEVDSGLDLTSMIQNLQTEETKDEEITEKVEEPQKIEDIFEARIMGGKTQCDLKEGEVAMSLMNMEQLMQKGDEDPHQEVQTHTHVKDLCQVVPQELGDTDIFEFSISIKELED